MAAVTDAMVAELLAADIRNPGPVVPVITAMAKAYTRGRGFNDGAAGDEPNAELAAVITAASARMAANVRQISVAEALGDMTSDVRTYFQGWTVAELAVLNRYRVRAM